MLHAIAIVAVTLVTALAVLLYDTVASLASRSFGFNYGFASVGSFALYALAGFAAARVATFDAALLVGAVAGLVDVTLGWRISWLIGPGRLPGGELTWNEWKQSAAMMIPLAAGCAAAGAWFAVRI